MSTNCVRADMVTYNTVQRHHMYGHSACTAANCLQAHPVQIYTNLHTHTYGRAGTHMYAEVTHMCAEVMGFKKIKLWLQYLSFGTGVCPLKRGFRPISRHQAHSSLQDQTHIPTHRPKDTLLTSPMKSYVRVVWSLSGASAANPLAVLMDSGLNTTFVTWVRSKEEGESEKVWSRTAQPCHVKKCQQI